jgi:hypothetical protein
MLARFGEVKDAAEVPPDSAAEVPGGRTILGP